MSFDLFAQDFRLREIDKDGDPLRQLDEAIDWEQFRATLEEIRPTTRKSSAGRKPFDAVLMFKIMVIQSLYNLSDDAVEFQVRDRLSFMRFLGLTLSDRVPDAKTIWLFRERLIQADLIEVLFTAFNDFLTARGFAAHKGQIIDASIVAAPRQRNKHDENVKIKDGQAVEEWAEKPCKQRQKDVDARWTRKNNVNHYGYKNHIGVDAEHKFIRRWSVTQAAVHDSQVFEELLDESNTNADVWADSAYRTPTNIKVLESHGYREKIQRKAARGRPLSPREIQGNRTRSKVRSRVEHIFGIQAMRAGTLLLRTIGIARARCKIGLRNLSYNMARLGTLTAPSG